MLFHVMRAHIDEAFSVQDATPKWRSLSARCTHGRVGTSTDRGSDQQNIETASSTKTRDATLSDVLQLTDPSGLRYIHATILQMGTKGSMEQGGTQDMHTDRMF